MIKPSVTTRRDVATMQEVEIRSLRMDRFSDLLHRIASFGSRTWQPRRVRSPTVA
jgi:hypothetical protein